MTDWERVNDRVDYAVEFRKDGKCENKNGQNIVSHVSHAEIQAPEGVKRSIEFREENPSFFDRHFDK